ncbi:unnamed protein product [Prunus armeniaca]
MGVSSYKWAFGTKWCKHGMGRAGCNPIRVMIHGEGSKWDPKALNHFPSLGLADCEGKEGNRLFSGSSAWKSCGRPGRKAPIWKTLPGTPKQPSSVECGYYVMRFMRDIIMDPSLEFEKKFAKGKDQAPYPQAAIDEVRKEWAEFVCLHMD